MVKVFWLSVAGGKIWDYLVRMSVFLGTSFDCSDTDGERVHAEPDNISGVLLFG